MTNPVYKMKVNKVADHLVRNLYHDYRLLVEYDIGMKMLS
jgi:hypothetical protein